jgi:hypothetical protein
MPLGVPFDPFAVLVCRESLPQTPTTLRRPSRESRGYHPVSLGNLTKMGQDPTTCSGVEAWVDAFLLRRA